MPIFIDGLYPRPEESNIEHQQKPFQYASTAKSAPPMLTSLLGAWRGIPDVSVVSVDEAGNWSYQLTDESCCEPDFWCYLPPHPGMD